MTEASDWPQWRGSERDGRWLESDVLTMFPSEGLRVAWRAAIGRGWSSPVVTGGRVVVTDVIVDNAAASERILCFAELDGQLLWEHRYPVAYPEWALEPAGGGPRATPVIRDSRVYSLGSLGDLMCLNLATGHVIWRKNLAREYGVEPFSGITASPMIDGDRLILQLSAKPNACVVAFDLTTGGECWRALGDSFTYSSPIILTAGGKRQLIVWSQEAVTSLDPQTGATWWREVSPTPGDMAVATPVWHQDRLLVGGMMFRLETDRPAATLLWPESEAPKNRVLSNTSTALLRDGFVYSAKTSGELVCLDASSGNLVWQSTEVTAPGNGSSIHLTPSGETVFLFTDQGDLISAQLTPQGYRELSRAHLVEPTFPFGNKKRAWTAPAFANRHVLLRNDLELIRVSLAIP
jgi:hypothetical protein